MLGLALFSPTCCSFSNQRNENYYKVEKEGVNNINFMKNLWKCFFCLYFFSQFYLMWSKIRFILPVVSSFASNMAKINPTQRPSKYDLQGNSQSHLPCCLPTSAQIFISRSNAVSLSPSVESFIQQNRMDSALGYLPLFDSQDDNNNVW